MRFQFDITASAPGFNKSHTRIFLDYENPRPQAYLYLGPQTVHGRHKNSATQEQSNPFEKIFYCPESNDCSERGEKVVCRQDGGRWICDTRKKGAQADSLNAAKGMACGCLNAVNWDSPDSRNRSTSTTESHSLPRTPVFDRHKIDF